MTDLPWQGDACSLVDAYRAGERHPVEELEATLAAAEASDLNAFSHLDPDAARAAAKRADVTKPFGGVPVPVKELESVSGWPSTGASVPLKDRIADHDDIVVSRLRDTGAVLFGLTTASEFGGVNLTRTHLNGATHNPWGHGSTCGGSSGGAAAAVAGGIATIATAGDGGGSIRIPAAFCGLPGLKATFGRYPHGPNATVNSMTGVWGCTSRSIRDIARWLDCHNGYDRRDPYSHLRVDGYEAGLGSLDLRGLNVAIAPSLGAAVIHSEVEAAVRDWADWFVAATGAHVVDVPVKLPSLGLEWALSGLSGVISTLGDHYPDRKDDLTFEILFGLNVAEEHYSITSRAKIEKVRGEFNEAMAAIFDEADIVIAATNPDVAFAADGPMPWIVEGTNVDLGNNGALTIPSNIYGNPAISIPAGVSPTRGLPIGVQVLAGHHAEPLLLDIAALAERERPWPLVAPGAPV